MTPLQIRMLLDIHTSPQPVKRLTDHPGNPYDEALNWFCDEGLITPHPHIAYQFSTTPRGAAYVHFLTTLPLPNAAWTIPSPINFSLVEAK